MDLRQLRHFVTVAHELHFGRAAEKLHMTQPPLSQSIQILEEEIGQRLFLRTKRSVQLTSVGAHWLPYVERVLTDAGKLPSLATQLARGEVGTLHISFVSSADYHVLPSLVANFKNDHPGIELSLQEATSDLQVEQLLSRTVDAGLIVPPPKSRLPDALNYIPLVREELIAAVPASWIRQRRLRLRSGQISLRDFAREALLLFPRRIAPTFHDAITEWYDRSGLKLYLGQEAIQMQTLVSLVSAGLGGAIVPASLRNLGRTDVRFLSFVESAPEIETGLAWHPENDSAALRNFVQLARRMSDQ